MHQKGRNVERSHRLPTTRIKNNVSNPSKRYHSLWLVASPFTVRILQFLYRIFNFLSSAVSVSLWKKKEEKNCISRQIASTCTCTSQFQFFSLKNEYFFPSDSTSMSLHKTLNINCCYVYLSRIVTRLRLHKNSFHSRKNTVFEAQCELRRSCVERNKEK